MDVALLTLVLKGQLCVTFGYLYKGIGFLWALEHVGP